MGYGNYSEEAHVAITSARSGQSEAEVFVAAACGPELDPRGVTFREALDSPEHPASLPIVFVLDVSSSMEDVPLALATKTLPTFMAEARRFAPDVQVCFMAVGNAWTDRSPLQVGQFESEATKIDRWLSALHLESGGGNLGESYDLAMYFVSRHTRVDAWEKRQKKGYVFFTGDEPPFAAVDSGLVSRIVGDTMQDRLDIYTVTEELQRKWHVFFLIPDAARAERDATGTTWDNILHEAAVVLDRPADAAVVAALLVGLTEGAIVGAAAVGPYLETIGVTGADRDRIATTVARYAEAVLRGPPAAPVRMGVRERDPSIRG